MSDAHTASRAPPRLQEGSLLVRREELPPSNGSSEEVLRARLEARAGAPNKTAPKGKGEDTEETLRAAEVEMNSMRILAYVGFPIAVILAIIFEAFHFGWSEVDWTLPLPRSDGLQGSEKVDNSMYGITVNLAFRAASLSRIYFVGAGRVKGMVYLLTLVAIQFVDRYLEYMTIDFSQRYWNLYQQPSLPLFIALVHSWFIIHSAHAIVGVYGSYVESMFMLHSKDHLTRYFEAIWIPNVYVFTMREGKRFDNPDQRIQEDVPEFVHKTYHVTFGVLKILSSIAMYSYILTTATPKSMRPSTLIGTVVMYSAVGSCVMHYLGSALPHYSWLGDRLSGDFRAELRRVYDQSETVASVRSHNAELARLQHCFENIKLNTWQSMILDKKLALFNNWYSPLRDIMFLGILAPSFIRGEISLGRLKQVQIALSRASDALSYLVDHYALLAGYRATVDRLYNFRACSLGYLKDQASGTVPGTNQPDYTVENHLIQELAIPAIPAGWPEILGGISHKAVPPSAPPRPSGAQLLELDASTLSLPSGEVLLRDVRLQFAQGCTVLLCGREGAGKSTLLHALAGMWPYVEYVVPPKCAAAQDLVLVPQKPQLPVPMSLRDAVTFPKPIGAFPDQEIQTALEQVGLFELAAKGLDTTMDVNSVLSGGEFQKLMVAHCLLAKPAWILLDESMAHLSRDNRKHMYSLLCAELVNKCGTGLISTCHNWQDLVPFHKEFYKIETKDAQESSRFQRKLVTFQPDKHSSAPTVSDELRSRISAKDTEISRLRQELLALQQAKKSTSDSK